MPLHQKIKFYRILEFSLVALVLLALALAEISRVFIHQQRKRLENCRSLHIETGFFARLVGVSSY
jgi:hypothetical protein